MLILIIFDLYEKDIQGPQNPKKTSLNKTARIASKDFHLTFYLPRTPPEIISPCLLYWLISKHPNISQKHEICSEF